MVVVVAVVAVVVQIVTVRAVAIRARGVLHVRRVGGIAEGELPRELVVDHDGRAMAPVVKVSTFPMKLGTTCGARLTARSPATRLAHMARATSGVVVRGHPSATAKVMRGVGCIPGYGYTCAQVLCPAGSFTRGQCCQRRAFALTSSRKRVGMAWCLFAL